MFVFPSSDWHIRIMLSAWLATTVPTTAPTIFPWSSQCGEVVLLIAAVVLLWMWRCNDAINAPVLRLGLLWSLLVVSLNWLLCLGLEVILPFPQEALMVLWMTLAIALLSFWLLYWNHLGKAAAGQVSLHMPQTVEVEHSLLVQEKFPEDFETVLQAIHSLDDMQTLEELQRQLSALVEHQSQRRMATLLAINECLRQQLNQFEHSNQVLTQQEARLQVIVSENADGIVIVNLDGIVRYVNPAAEKLFGRSSGELLGIDWGIPIHSTGVHEIQILRKDQDMLTAVDVEMRVTQIEWENEPAYLSSLRDVTERKQCEERLAYEASHDSLTNLPNRSWFERHLAKAIARSCQQSMFQFAVLFLDLDGFKAVNDRLGHSVGDQLLQAIARRLALSLRPSDQVARLGGDEFAILLNNINGINDAITIAERIHTTLATPLLLSGHEVCTTASIGIALSNPKTQTVDGILRQADTAMYGAKRMGRGCYEVFGSEMRACVLTPLHAGMGLRQALEQQELEVFYQPIVELISGKVVGMEALVRWFHPERGIINPADFIPVAEETGLIVPLGAWVLREACLQARRWQEEMPFDSPISISVNLSSKQLIQPALITTIESILRETSLPPTLLNLEITESVIVESCQNNESLLQWLRSQGIRISIDDFGTGYSSLSYLHRLPVDVLKIDASFIQRMSTDRESLEIVKAIMTLAHAIGIEVTAEGVEKIEQLQQLQMLQCHFVQGYLFAAAQDSQTSSLWLKKQRHSTL